MLATDIDTRSLDDLHISNLQVQRHDVVADPLPENTFELAGIAAIFSTAGLILAIVMSIAQELWIIAAAVGLGVVDRVAVVPTEKQSIRTDSVPHSALKRELSGRPSGT